MNQQKKILVIAPSWVGDLVMSQVLFKFLKQQDATCTIDVFANKALHGVLAHMPEVDKPLVSPFDHGELRLLDRFKLAKKLRESFYTHAYVLPNSLKSALIPFWAKIPNRIGWLGECRYLLLNTVRGSIEKSSLMVERLVALGVEADESLPQPLPLPLPRLQVSSAQIDSSLKQLSVSLSQKPVLAICPGAEYGVAKRWPAEYFVKVAQSKKQEGWDVWIFGGPKDRAIAQEIQSKSGNATLDLVGKTSLSDAITLLSLAKAVVTNDSGLMHVAAALDRPLVAIYGSSSPKHTPPLTNKAKILTLNLPCSPCFKRECPLGHMNCLNDMQPDMVERAIDEIITK